jgi:hypothetical protein
MEEGEMGFAIENVPLEKVLQAIEENVYYLPTPQGVRAVINDLRLKVEGDLEEFTERVLEEARRRTREALEGLWKTLGLSSPPPGVEKTLHEGGWVELWHPDVRRNATSGRERGLLRLEGGGQIEVPPLPSSLKGFFAFRARGGRVEVKLSPWFFARRGRAYLRTFDPEEAERVLEGVGLLRPLFEAIGLSDLEEALDVLLKKFEDGEARMENQYFLAREGRFRALRRGSLLGSPALDKVFLLGGRVLLSYPQGVEVALQGTFPGHEMGLEEMEVRWRGEAARFRKELGGSWNALDERPLASLVKRALRWGQRTAGHLLSPNMNALIEELAESEDPLQALEAEDFFRRVHMRALSSF